MRRSRVAVGGCGRGHVLRPFKNTERVNVKATKKLRSPSTCAAVVGMCAVTQAHCQQKRVKATFYNCGFTYCNSYEYKIIS